MKKTILTLALVFFVILAVSCEIETNYPAESSGSLFVSNDSASGKTITRIVVTTNWGLGNPSTEYNNRVSIPPGGKSEKIEISISDSDFISRWNQFRVTITLNDNSTVSKDITVYEDIVNNLRYNGTSLVDD